MGGTIELAPNPPPAAGVASVEPLWKRYGSSPADAARKLVAQRLTWAEKRALVQGMGTDLANHEYVGTIPAIPRLSIPSMNIHDAGQGFRTTHSSHVGQVTAFPSALAGMLGLFSTLCALQATVPKAADKIASAAQPGCDFISRWLALFFVPNLVVLPLVLQLSAAEFAKQSDVCWHFCEAAALPPSLFERVFCSAAVEALPVRADTVVLQVRARMAAVSKVMYKDN